MIESLLTFKAVTTAVVVIGGIGAAGVETGILTVSDSPKTVAAPPSPGSTEAKAVIEDPAGTEASKRQVTPRLAPGVPTVVLTAPGAPGTGYTVTGKGFQPESWIWVDIDDTSNNTQPVHGPDAFQAADDGGFSLTGPATLACGDSHVAKAFVNDKVVATSGAFSSKCASAPAGPALSLTVPDGPGQGFTVRGRGFAVDKWIWVTVEDQTVGNKPIDGPSVFQPGADGTFSRADARTLACNHDQSPPVLVVHGGARHGHRNTSELRVGVQHLELVQGLDQLPPGRRQPTPDQMAFGHGGQVVLGLGGGDAIVEEGGRGGQVTLLQGQAAGADEDRSSA